jgi:hypothetical protein
VSTTGWKDDPVSGDDPEETMPFTHRSFGSEEPVDPTKAPDGSASQPSGAGFVPPSVGPPPMTSPPYAAPPYAAPVYGAPVYGAAAYGGQHHAGASRSKTLGIVALVCAGVAFFCCISLPGVFVAPFAWVVGARAKREIDASPGVYSNRGDAEAGVVMGIIGTVIAVLAVVGTVLFVVMIASMSWAGV